MKNCSTILILALVMLMTVIVWAGGGIDHVTRSIENHPAPPPPAAAATKRVAPAPVATKPAAAEPAAVEPDMAADLRPSPSGRPVVRTLHAADLSFLVSDKANNAADTTPLFNGYVRVVGEVVSIRNDGNGYVLFLGDLRHDSSRLIACQMLIPGNYGKNHPPVTDPKVLGALRTKQKVCVVGTAGGTYPLTLLPTASLDFCELETACPY